MQGAFPASISTWSDKKNVRANSVRPRDARHEKNGALAFSTFSHCIY
jgi:hypothetical protein